MNILYVCHRFPFPPKRGGKIRPFNMISHLHRRGHKVWVASMARSEVEATEAEGIADHCHDYFVARVGTFKQAVRMALRVPTLIPASMGYFYSRSLDHYIRGVLANHRIDLIFVHCSSVAPYVSRIRGIPKILDFGDMDSQKWLSYTHFKPLLLRPGYWWEGVRLERAEKSLAKQFDLCTATTRREWETLEAYGTGVETDWFPNGVDGSYFSPSDEDYDRRAISFVGRMDYYPNQECMLRFCRQILPLLKLRVPDLKLYIVGAEPSRVILDLARIDGVTVTGSVPDVRPYVRRTAAMVAPLAIARGTQNKILESMAMGVPVVSSPSASGGIDAVSGEHFLVADAPEDWASQILRLLENPAERMSFAAAGRRRVLAQHDWKASMERLDGIVAGCLARYRQAPPHQARD
ncbi:MAG: TIGR03087 family PEP-CTERM/XrtA system glycosyltransferase [Pseudomonadales bacterium]|nr:TIGR03087 family PEP-CTERM/XrtA system glycosyltransferase [Pseudomonadales bacterium]